MFAGYQDAAKVLIIKHWGGGKSRAWLRDKDNNITDDVKLKVTDDGDHEIVKRLEHFAPIIKDLFLEQFPEMKRMVADVNERLTKNGRRELKT
eukprot:COSAG02_NODE_45794_length_354_cov_0.611765_1_plen_92_part_01